MRKYRTKRWPFFIFLFSGLACSLTLPNENTEGTKEKHTASIQGAKNVEKVCGRKNKNGRSTLYNEGYPVGPQLLLVLQ